MAEIISFAKHHSRAGKRDNNRWKQLATGSIESYVCDSCGTKFEIVDNKKPEKCPECLRVIIW